MTYPEACQYLGREVTFSPTLAGSRATNKPQWEPRVTEAPGDTWQAKARKLVDDAVYNLGTPYGKPMLGFLTGERGLNEETIKKFSLGFLPLDRWEAAPAWGLVDVIKDDGTAKKLWFPRGLTIPLCQDNQVLRVRIRRPKSDGDPRYFLLRGSDTRAMILGTDKPVSVIVESELDALLLHQEGGYLVNIISLGNAQARPDQETADLLKQSQLILVALDSDPSGAKESWQWWAAHYPQAPRWPSIRGKDPGEMWAAGVNIRTWVEAGLTEYKDVAAQPEHPIHLASAEEELAVEVYQPAYPKEEEHVLIDGTCFFHHCELASYQSAALFCGEASQEVIDLLRCPLGLWFKQADGWPVVGIP